jgi:hypothetical protein
MGSPAHPRHRAVVRTDALIAQAEQLRAAQALVLQSLAAAGHSTRRAAMLLQLTEQRLEQLRASRQYLLGEQPMADA